MKTTPNTSSRAVTPRILGFSALGAYFAVLLVGILLNGGKASPLDTSFVIYLHPLIYAVAWLVLGGILVVYGSISKVFVYRFTWLAAMGYAVATAACGGSSALTVALCGLVALMTYACGKALREEGAFKKATAGSLSLTGGKIAVGVVAALGGGLALFLLLSSYLSYTTSPSVSTGVYIQMMESLRGGLSFDTTLEFGEQTSHLAAHISPIFLLYLPFYLLIPSPVTLMLLQVAAVFSAVIPLWLICRDKGLNPALSALTCGLLCFFPAVWEGAAGSVHEYALLLPLLLWLMWALSTRRRVLPWVFAALILCVRETCAIHLLTVGLYHALTASKESGNPDTAKRERARGLILAGISLVYFIVAMVVLTHLGKGTLITRFDNVTGEYGTFFDSLLRAILYDPAIAVYEMLTEAKLHYVLFLLLPVGLIPLFTRKRAGLVFLLPLLLLNLLSDFPFHFRLDFPYSFGVAAYALYLTADGLASLTRRTEAKTLAKRLTVLAVCCTLVVGGFRLAGYGLHAEYALTGRQETAAVTAVLEAVDREASVSASGRLIPALAARGEIYPLSAKAETEIVVLDLREDWTLPAEEDYTVEYYQKLGYTVVESADGVCAVLKKNG